ncbi:MAG: cyclic nucleotide-binding domain-containing protein [Opitutales bacterium]|nr:cyclic nucleotide-binding domain-containing protein [Opitutales bacterium]
METMVFDALLNSPLTYKLEPADVQILADFVYFRWLEKDEYLFHEDDPAIAFGYLMEGRLAVLKKASTGKEQIISYLPHGRLVGVMEIIDGEPRVASVKAMQVSRLLMLKRNDLELIERRFPRIGQSIMISIVRVLSAHLRQADTILAGMYGQPAPVIE